MSPNEFIGLVLSILGLGLSAYFGINKIISDRRRIKVMLKVGKLVLVNTGHRPVTITSIRIKIKTDDGWRSPISPDLRDNSSPLLEGNPLPAKLNDGEMLEIPVVEEDKMTLYEKATKDALKIEVTDAEGNIYDKFEWR